MFFYLYSQTPQILFIKSVYTTEFISFFFLHLHPTSCVATNDPRGAIASANKSINIYICKYHFIWKKHLRIWHNTFFVVVVVVVFICVQS